MGKKIFLSGPRFGMTIDNKIDGSAAVASSQSSVAVNLNKPQISALKRIGKPNPPLPAATGTSDAEAGLGSNQATRFMVTVTNDHSKGPVATSSARDNRSPITRFQNDSPRPLKAAQVQSVSVRNQNKNLQAPEVSESSIEIVDLEDETEALPTARSNVMLKKTGIVAGQSRIGNAPKPVKLRPSLADKQQIRNQQLGEVVNASLVTAAVPENSVPESPFNRKRKLPTMG